MVALIVCYDCPNPLKSSASCTWCAITGLWPAVTTALISVLTPAFVVPNSRFFNISSVPRKLEISEASALRPE